MMKKYIKMVCLLGMLCLPIEADDHTEFLGLPLSLSPAEMIDELSNKGMQQEDSFSLSGRISGLNVWLNLNSNRDTSALNSILLSTKYQQGRTPRDDYKKMMKWMRHHYGAPTWEATVRGHAFARWFLDFDRDIVMIATAKSSVDIWFYDNHSKRNVDYYSILKYCERNPSDEVPYYTARECVTWRSTSVPTTKKTTQVKGKTKKKVKVRKTTKNRQRTKSRTSQKRRRR
ncbi:MAG: hypothetical protein IJ929_00470 [Prevotella sp.]|nr:hypothetical protein [Prevotella sp.]